MQDFQYLDGTLHAEGVAVTEIQEKFGTPSYVYSRAAIERQWQSYEDSFKDRSHCICYAVKANGNLAILNLLARLGSGFDIVSVGELQRVIKAGGDAGKVVFSGVGKTPDEIRTTLQAGVKCLNVESLSELQMVDKVAGELQTRAPVSLRINPDVDPVTHPYISTGLKENKFGIAYEEAVKAFEQANAMVNLNVTGIDCHIGSQITGLEPYLDAIDRILQLVELLSDKGIGLDHIDLGGGLGISYKDETPPTPAEFVTAISEKISESSLEIIIEPGRSIIGNAGILITQVLYLKQNGVKNFAIIDAAMNDLIRPVLYDAWQDIVPVKEDSDANAQAYDIVGPICE
ncbi:MAG: diaminopimelate decarboxylase, partial [Gammaproteobacteria bacterium]|nr:diaminopimelate decarboxylase [Gammaproteobacteria bacterium]